MALAVIDLVEVDAQHDRRVGVARGGRDDHLLGALREVLGGALAVGEQPGGLDHHVDPELAPRQRRRVALGEHLQLFAVDVERALAAGADRARIRPEDRVVLEQVRERARVGQVVDRHPLDLLCQLLAPGLRGAEHVSADAAESVDPDAYWHALPPEAEMNDAGLGSPVADRRCRGHRSLRRPACGGGYQRAVRRRLRCRCKPVPEGWPAGCGPRTAISACTDGGGALTVTVAVVGASSTRASAVPETAAIAHASSIACSTATAGSRHVSRKRRSWPRSKRMRVRLQLLDMRPRCHPGQLRDENARGHVVRCGERRCSHTREQLRRVGTRAELGDDLGEPLVPEQLIPAAGLDETVGEEARNRAPGQRHRRLPAPRRHCPPDWRRSADGEWLTRLQPKQDRRRMARAGIRQDALAGVVHAHHDRREVLHRAVGQHPSGQRQRRARLQPGLQVGAQRVAHQRRLRQSFMPVAGDIADDQRDPAGR